MVSCLDDYALRYERWHSGVIEYERTIVEGLDGVRPGREDAGSAVVHFSARVEK